MKSADGLPIRQVRRERYLKEKKMCLSRTSGRVFFEPRSCVQVVHLLIDSQRYVYCFFAGPGSEFTHSPILIPPRTRAKVWCNQNVTYPHSWSFYMQTKRHQQFHLRSQISKIEHFEKVAFFLFIVTFLATSLLQRHSGILKQTTLQRNVTKGTSFISTFCIYCNSLVIVLKCKHCITHRCKQNRQKRNLCLQQLRHQQIRNSGCDRATKNISSE